MTTIINIDLIGYIAAVLTTFSTSPQIISMYKSKCSEGISLYMFFILLSGVLLWGIYGYQKNDLPYNILFGRGCF